MISFFKSLQGAFLGTMLAMAFIGGVESFIDSMKELVEQDSWIADFYALMVGVGAGFSAWLHK